MWSSDFTLATLLGLKPSSVARVKSVKSCFLVKSLESIEKVAMKFGTDIQGTQRINCIDFGDLLTFLLKIAQNLLDVVAQHFAQHSWITSGVS